MVSRKSDRKREEGSNQWSTKQSSKLPFQPKNFSRQRLKSSTYVSLIVEFALELG